MPTIKTVAEMRAMLTAVETRRGRRVFDLPASGQISAGQINEELGRAYAAEFHIGGVEERGLAGVPTGQISFSDFHGKTAFTNVLNSQPFPISPSVFYGYGNGLAGTLTPLTVTLGGQVETITLVGAGFNSGLGTYSIEVGFSTLPAYTGNIELKITGAPQASYTLPYHSANVWRLYDDALGGALYSYLQGQLGIDLDITIREI